MIKKKGKKNELTTKVAKKMDHECPKNHFGSSKSMETKAIYQMVKEAFYEQGFFIATIISDDDSTMKSNLRQSYKEKIKKGLLERKDWSKTAKGKEKQDNGRLQLCS